MSVPVQPRSRLGADMQALVQRQRIQAGLLAEQRHQDLDPDSACCPQGFTCPACPPRTDGDGQ